ncbi:metal ABC transporter permease [Streptomyces sp. SID13031]|uniref:metal ABC transporter permease n=1 Tax=Streptomyces sp. SID13031 TaxID=2706046 RepID=UPI0013CD8E0D|nr:metal ABC transporter permease [Streptomyces sp. SID13031]NEA37158.1 metal ABC transporter permease [Streptomyces sp. SID13031]
MTLFQLEFMQRALIAGLLTGLSAPAIGTYLVQRRLSLMGDGIGHIAITGVALGLLTGTAPVLTAVLVAIAGATAIELVRARGKASGDVALALLFYGGIAGGVLLIGLAGQGAATLNTYLFGSLTTVSPSDLYIVVGLAVTVLVVAIGLGPQLFAVCQDEEFARVTGLRVQLLNLLIAVMAAVTVTVAMRTVGLLLVSALMVVPVATAQQFTRSFRSTFVTACGIGVAACLAGIITSYNANVAPGATIVVLALGGFIVAAVAGTLVRRRRGVLAPLDDEEPEGGLLLPEPHVVSSAHQHAHDPKCGHPKIDHGDHVDYVHDGHLHAAHGDHWDEH